MIGFIVLHVKTVVTTIRVFHVHVHVQCTCLTHSCKRCVYLLHVHVMMLACFQVKQAMSSSQSVAVSVPNPIQTATNAKSTSSSPAPSSEAPGATGGANEGSQTSQQQSSQQQQNEQRKAQQAAALKQVKLTTLKHPPGIDPIAIVKERESRSTHITNTGSHHTC